jgi:hypothetical protein
MKFARISSSYIGAFTLDVNSVLNENPRWHPRWHVNVKRDVK